MHFHERKRIEEIVVYGAYHITGVVNTYAVMYSEDEVLWRYYRKNNDTTIRVSADNPIVLSTS